MVFEVGLAEVYDLIYQDKDYEGETDFVEGLFRDYSRRSGVTILDGGCGTGGHALPLARRGYQVTGIDASAEMVKLASEKAGKAGLDIGFHAVDMLFNFAFISLPALNPNPSLSPIVQYSRTFAQ